MTDMVDLSSEARGAVYAALHAALGDDWQVFDTVPQGTQPNFLKVGAVDTTNEGRPGEQFERLTVEVIGIYQGEDRGVLGAMMFAARRALDDQVLSTDAASFPECRFVAGSISDASREDGVTYAALSTFELLGEAA